MKLRRSVHFQNRTDEVDVEDASPNSKYHQSKFQRIYDACRLNDTKYEDMEFPPGLKSIVGPKFMEATPRQFYSKIEWKRLGEIYPRAVLFCNSTEVTDIRQGILGNTSFLSTLTSIAEFSDSIMRLFETQELNQYGVYSVWLSINGEWKNIIVDDYIPVKQDTVQPAFARGVENEIWVMILEKAYAKAYGYYEKIELVDPASIFNDLTGAPVEVIDKFSKMKPDKLWEKLYDSDQKEHVMSCWVKEDNEDSMDDAIEQGLNTGLPYSLIRLEVVRNSEGEMERIMQMRNSIGKSTWIGDWGPGSLKWTQDLLKSLKVTLQNKIDGIFWIGYSDFLKFFEGGFICKRGKEHVSTALVGKYPKTQNTQNLLFSFQVTAPCFGYVFATQNDCNLIDVEDESFEYSFKRVYLIREVKEGSDYRVLDVVLSNERLGFASHQLEIGSYLMMVEVYWDVFQDRNLSVGTYLKEVTNMERFQCPQKIMDKIIGTGIGYLYWNHHFKFREEEHFYHSLKTDIFTMTMKEKLIPKSGLGLLVFMNKSEEMKFKEEFTLTLDDNRYEVFVNKEKVEKPKIVLKMRPSENRMRMAVVWIRYAPIFYKSDFNNFNYNFIFQRRKATISEIKSVEGNERPQSIEDRLDFSRDQASFQKIEESFATEPVTFFKKGKDNVFYSVVKKATIVNKMTGLGSKSSSEYKSATPKNKLVGAMKSALAGVRMKNIQDQNKKKSPTENEMADLAWINDEEKKEQLDTAFQGSHKVSLTQGILAKYMENKNTQLGVEAQRKGYAIANFAVVITTLKTQKSTETKMELNGQAA